MISNVCHLTIVHNRYDPRILEKQCVSLANSGYKVDLLVSDNLADETFKNVNIKSIGNFGKRLNLNIVYSVIRYYRVNKYSIIQFHDPELIFLALILKVFFRVEIIYDVHEDYVTAVNHKKQNFIIKNILKIGFILSEYIAKKLFYIIIAEKYYIYRFPKAVSILNYPIINNDNLVIERNYSVKRLIYTGNVTISRGALNHTGIVNRSDDYEIYFVGKCEKLVHDKIRMNVKTNNDKIHFEDIGKYITFNKIKKRYEEDWLAGLAVFPKTKHYEQKELTKFFEYMYEGLPIICSNFPVWKNLVELNKCGICVDPDNMDEILNAINYLYINQDIARLLGQNGRHLVQTQFNWQVEEKKLLNLYDVIINHKE